MSIAAILLDKAANDGGFPIAAGADGPWQRRASAHAPLIVWLRAEGDGALLAVDRADVAQALIAAGVAPSPAPPPAGGVQVFALADPRAAQRVLARAHDLAQALPDAPLLAFTAAVAAELAAAPPPSTTEVERLVRQRVGQDIYRASLMKLWGGRCAVTGLAEPALLRASHARPWARCDSDADRLNPFNGLLLAAHLDAAFDAGLIAVADDGALLCAPMLGAPARALLGLDTPRRIAALQPEHAPFMAWHRAEIFAKG